VQPPPSKSKAQDAELHKEYCTFSTSEIADDDKESKETLPPSNNLQNPPPALTSAHLVDFGRTSACAQMKPTVHELLIINQIHYVSIVCFTYQ
jgi:hypothetical protein